MGPLSEWYKRYDCLAAACHSEWDLRADLALAFLSPDVVAAIIGVSGLTQACAGVDPGDLEPGSADPKCFALSLRAGLDPPGGRDELPGVMHNSIVMVRA